MLHFRRRKKKIVILGSCVSRDIMECNSVRNCELVFYSARTKIVSQLSPSYKVDAEIGNEATLEIELLERTIKGNSETKTSLLWLTDVAKFTFTAERAGYYTITLVSDFESDKISISNIVSESSIVPKKITDADQSSNPYQATYFVSETNISDGRSKIFICDFESDSDYSSKKEGDKIIYKILIEYSETAPKA